LVKPFFVVYSHKGSTAAQVSTQSACTSVICTSATSYDCDATITLLLIE